MAEPARPDESPPTQPPLKPVQETSSSADEHTAGLPSSDADETLDFLGKAQGPGELGRLDHFRILKELGRGGMGCVLLAEDTQLERQVALKIMLPRFARDEKARTRFLREAKAAAKIHHDHVITIHAVGQAHGVPYIAMEFLKGTALDKYLKEKGELPLPQVLRIGREIALGLAEAHKKGLIHRDIKPANVWLESPKGRVKILDFGLARQEAADEAHLTQSGAIVGTPSYMAPEQAHGEVDARADLFSLGVLLYRLTTGTAPFTGATTMAVLLQVATHEPPTVHEVKSGLPAEMGRIIAKLLAKEKASRYGTASEFLGDWEKLMRSPKAEAATEALAKPLEQPASRRAGSVSAGRTEVKPSLTLPARKWLVVGLGLLLLLLAAWYLIPRGTTPVVVKDKEKSPSVVAPPSGDPPELDATNAAEVQRLWAAKLKLPVEKDNSIGMKLRLIPPGVLVKYPYYVGKYEVTQGEWTKVLGYNPSQFKGPNLPVEIVSWFDCVEFCNKLSERGGLPLAYELTVKQRKGSSIEEAEVKILGGPGYRIPTDPEWEHGCRAGTTTKYCFGDNDAELGEYAWYVQNSRGKTHPVGELKPNGFGLYDIHGNVREWNEEMLKNATTGAPERVPRGGSWILTAGNCAVASRYRYAPAPRPNNIGLRLAQVPFGEAQAGK